MTAPDMPTADQIRAFLDQPVYIPAPKNPTFAFEGTVEWNGWPGWVATITLTYPDGTTRKGSGTQGTREGAIEEAMWGAK